MWGKFLRSLNWLPLFLVCSIAYAGGNLQIPPGHQQVLQAPGVTKASVGNSAVATAKALPGSQQVVITGKSTGRTDLILWLKDGSKDTYAITVSGAPAGTPSSDIGSLMKDIEGVMVRHVNGRTVIDGEIFRGEDLERIRKTTELFPDVVNLTRVNTQALALLARQSDIVLKEGGITTVSVRGAGDSLILEGSVSGKHEEDRVLRTVRAVYPNLVSHLAVGLDMEPLILIDVKLMEIRKAYLSAVGIRWPSSWDAGISGALTPAGGQSSLTLASGTTVSLRSLVEKGAAKILANPKLLCRSGTPASFLAGGEIPIRVVGERTAQVLFKSYGVTLDINAKADRSRHVSLDVETTVSELDQATAVDGIPGILENHLKTAANLRFGDTVVLGGLLANRSRKNVQKVPLLGHIPILGELFKSRDFQNNDSEFLVLLSPIPADPGSAPHGQQMKQMYESRQKIDQELRPKVLD